MTLLSFISPPPKPKTASMAMERLQIIIAHERNGSSSPDFLPALHNELLKVISKYTRVNSKDIEISLNRKDNLEVIDINVVLPYA